MTPRKLSARRLLSAAVPLAAITLSACGDLRAGGAIAGCRIEYQSPSGAWDGDPYELHPFIATVDYYQFENGGCPVPILRPREQIRAAGTLFSNDVFSDRLKNTERVRLTIMDANRFTISDDEQPFVILNADSKRADVHVDYPAVRAHGTIGEKDLFQIKVVDYCCSTFLPQLRASIDLAISYESDAQFARVTVAGDAIPRSGDSRTWGAESPSAGRPHQYRWYRDGVSVGSGVTYAGTAGSSDFDLRVDMTDSYGRTATNTLRVDVDGVRIESLTGPSEVWASAGGGTWTASARGGSAPHEYAWYVNDRWVGDGASWSGYNVGHEGTFTLRVDVRNAEGATHGASREIMQIGTGSGGCDPPPGQDACVTP
ncbi:MAG TPA: hypothetical protein VE913_01805 [Longimicrobium sp.]|nr:hypothetical protein [Longimicrobium sp.]